MKFFGDFSKENENNDHFEEMYLLKKIPRFTPVVTKYSVGKYFLVLVTILKFGDVCLAFIFHKNNLSPNSSLSLRVNFHQVKIVKHQYQVKDTMSNFFDKAIPCPTLRLWVGKFIGFEFTHVLFWWTFLRSVKEINRFISKRTSNIYLKSDSHLPKKVCMICFIKSPLKLMKNAFYFISKALFVLKIFKFLSWLFGHVGRTVWLEW